VLGRDGTADVRLPSTLVSRRHAVLRRTQGGWTVEDLGSLNGTSVNGQRLGGLTALSHGDVLTLADVSLSFATVPAGSPGTEVVAGPEGWMDAPEPPSEQLTEAMHADGAPGAGDPVPAAQPSGPPAQQRAADGVSRFGLLLAVGGSLVGTSFSAALGAGQWGTLASAALGPVISAVFSTRATGVHGRVRAAAIAILTCVALGITVTGVSIADVVAGTSVLPGPQQGGTFPVVPAQETTAPGQGTVAPARDVPAISVTPETLDCGPLPLGTSGSCAQEVTVRSTGRARLKVTRLEVVGRDAEDFAAGDGCDGAVLASGEECTLTVSFAPRGTGSREATLVVHQNLPKPDRGTPVRLTGSGGGAGDVTVQVELDAPRELGARVLVDGRQVCPGECTVRGSAGTPLTLVVEGDVPVQSGWRGCGENPTPQACVVAPDQDAAVRVEVRQAP
jgi:hypothetical protein